MKKLQPEMEKIKQRHPDDRMKQQQEMMELYKREKVSPLTGCLPILIQIPVFFALYKVIYVTIEMRHAPFFGWIQDLSAPDPTSLFNLFGLIPWTPPHLPDARRLADHHGHHHVAADAAQSDAARSGPGAALQLDAAHLHLHARRPSRPASSSTGRGTTCCRSCSSRYIMKRQGVEIDFFGNIRDSLPFLKRKSAG